MNDHVIEIKCIQNQNHLKLILQYQLDLLLFWCVYVFVFIDHFLFCFVLFWTMFEFITLYVFFCGICLEDTASQASEWSLTSHFFLFSGAESQATSREIENRKKCKNCRLKCFQAQTSKTKKNKKKSNIKMNHLLNSQMPNLLPINQYQQ